MSGHYSPLTCCDSDCAGVNHCRIGGYECEGCGKWFCGSDLNEDGYCEDCAEERRKEEENDNDNEDRETEGEDNES